MEPRQFHPEQAPAPASRELSPLAGEFALPTIEQGVRPNLEQDRPRSDVREVNQQGMGAMPSVLPAPVPAMPSVVLVADDDSPIVAADEDLIEKEWVDKAKQIISATRDDPYRREQEIKRLQLDYVRKRYGKEIGAAKG